MIATDIVVKHEISTGGGLHAKNNYKIKVLKDSNKRWIHLRVKFHLIMLAFKTYGSITRSLKVLHQLNLIRESTMGPGNIKIIKVNGKYYHHLYAPGFPSKIFDEYIKGGI
jgi:hypothetical protein